MAPISIPLQQVEIEQPGGGKTRQACGDGHPDGGQRQGWPERHAKRGDPGAHAAVEQYDGERQVAHQVGDRVVGEGMPPGPSSPASMPTARKMTRMGMPTRDESALNRTLAPTNRAPIKKKLLMVVASNGELLVAVGKTGTLYAV